MGPAEPQILTSKSNVLFLWRLVTNCGSFPRPRGFLTYKIRASLVSETPSIVDILWLGDRERGRNCFLCWPGLSASHCFSPLSLSLGPRDFLAVTQWSRTPKFVIISVTSIGDIFLLICFFLSIHEDEHLTSLPALHSQEWSH